MKAFNFIRDMRAKDLLTGRIYYKNGITVYYACGYCVSTFCEGMSKFNTLKQAKEYIKTI